MRFVTFFALLALGTFLFTDSYRTSRTPEAPVASQPVFAGVSLRLEVASTTEERELGLGGRAQIPSDFGMLFVFPEPGLYGFWMKDMLIPIDMFWLDSDFRVVYMKINVSPDSYPEAYYPTLEAQYVLETQAGFGTTHGVATGTPLLLPSEFPISK